MMVGSCVCIEPLFTSNILCFLECYLLSQPIFHLSISSFRFPFLVFTPRYSEKAKNKKKIIIIKEEKRTVRESVSDVVVVFCCCCYCSHGCVCVNVFLVFIGLLGVSAVSFWGSIHYPCCVNKSSH